MYFSFFKLTSCVEKWAYYNLYAVSKVKTSSKKDIHTRHWICPSRAYIIDIMDSALVLYICSIVWKHFMQQCWEITDSDLVNNLSVVFSTMFILM